jgi:hypothetical protein
MKFGQFCHALVRVPARPAPLTMASPRPESPRGSGSGSGSCLIRSGGIWLDTVPALRHSPPASAALVSASRALNGCRGGARPTAGAEVARLPDDPMAPGQDCRTFPCSLGMAGRKPAARATLHGCPVGRKRGKPVCSEPTASPTCPASRRPQPTRFDQSSPRGPFVSCRFEFGSPLGTTVSPPGGKPCHDDDNR